MSMLAEKRSRQKWSDDPRNIRWASDKTKFGYTMLTKMGWSEGKGLGQTLSGETSHIRLDRRQRNAGIGLKKATDNDWIAQQDDFNALLSQLNGGICSKNKATNMQSLEAQAKASRKKILYRKFVKSKDLSNVSSRDLACIFGQRSKSAPVTPQISDDEEVSDVGSVESCPVSNMEKTHGVMTKNSSVSMPDYFARKMDALKQKKNVVVAGREGAEKSDKLEKMEPNDDLKFVDVAYEVSTTENKYRVASSKKKKTHDKLCKESQLKGNAEAEEKKKKTKKKKRKRKSLEEIAVCAIEPNEVINIDDVINDVVEVIDCDAEQSTKKQLQAINIVDLESDSDVIEIVKSSKKKKKKKSVEEVSIIQCDAKVFKDRKKRKHFAKEVISKRQLVSQPSTSSTLCKVATHKRTHEQRIKR